MDELLQESYARTLTDDYVWLDKLGTYLGRYAAEELLFPNPSRPAVPAQARILAALIRRLQNIEVRKRQCEREARPSRWSHHVTLYHDLDEMKTNYLQAKAAVKRIYVTPDPVERQDEARRYEDQVRKMKEKYLNNMDPISDWFHPV